MNFTVAIIALAGLLCCVSLSEGGANYTSLGCFRDKKKPVRALDSLEGFSTVLDGKFKRRENAVEKCAEAARNFELEIFAVARGGECLAGMGSLNGTFEMYGPSDNCQADGEGGRRPAAMEVYEIVVETCEELSETCWGDCCDGEIAVRGDFNGTFNEMRCPGYWDWNTGCQISADYCIPFEQENYRYAKSLGAPETCYGYCPPQCNYPEETYCEDYSSGCGYGYCYYVGANGTDFNPMMVRAATVGGNNETTCRPTCPTSCHPEFDMVCSNGVDSNGCSYGDYCLPSLTDSWDGTTCPGICYTPCDYAAGEVYCGYEQTGSCFTGNYCEIPDADGNACQGTAVRMDHVDERMLSGSPDDVSAFYKTLTNLAKK